MTVRRRKVDWFSILKKRSRLKKLKHVTQQPMPSLILPEREHHDAELRRVRNTLLMNLSADQYVMVTRGIPTSRQEIKRLFEERQRMLDDSK